MPKVEYGGACAGADYPPSFVAEPGHALCEGGEQLTGQIVHRWIAVAEFGRLVTEPREEFLMAPKVAFHGLEKLGGSDACFLEDVLPRRVVVSERRASGPAAMVLA